MWLDFGCVREWEERWKFMVWQGFVYVFVLDFIDIWGSFDNNCGMLVVYIFCIGFLVSVWDILGIFFILGFDYEFNSVGLVLFV